MDSAGSPAASTDYAWDVAAPLPVILQDGTNTYVYGLDLISAADGAGVRTYYLYDGLGSTTGLADASGSAVAGYAYDVFGAIRSQSGSSGNYWLFTGEQRDSESDLYYLRARYYDPSTGRFLTRDPFGRWFTSPQSQNPYVYVMNNPANLADPAGLQGAEVATGTVTVSCTAGAAASAGTVCVVGVVAAAGVVVYYTCVVGEACDALGGAILGAGGTIVQAGGALMEGIGDVAGDFGEMLFGKKKAKPDIKIRWTDEDRIVVHQPRFDDFWGGRPPDWSRWWKRLIVGGGIGWFVCERTGLCDALRVLFSDNRLPGEKLPPRQ